MSAIEHVKGRVSRSMLVAGAISAGLSAAMSLAPPTFDPQRSLPVAVAVIFGHAVAALVLFWPAFYLTLASRRRPVWQSLVQLALVMATAWIVGGLVAADPQAAGAGLVRALSNMLTILEQMLGTILAAVGL